MELDAKPWEVDVKIAADKELFWFWKEGETIDLADERQLDVFVQQVLTCGRAADVRRAFSIAGAEAMRGSLLRIRGFLPAEVRTFWEESLGNPDQDAA